MRRNLKRDTQPLTREQILNCLMPKWREEIQEYKTYVQTFYKQQLEKSAEESRAEIIKVAEQLRNCEDDQYDECLL